jgi:hypothetical protein
MPETTLGEIQSLAARQALIEGLDGDAFHVRQEFLSHHSTEEMEEAAHKLATTNTFQNQLTSFASQPCAPYWVPRPSTRLQFNGSDHGPQNKSGKRHGIIEYTMPEMWIFSPAE